MKRNSIIVFLLIFGLSRIFAAACGDVNSNGKVDIVDALLIAKIYVGENVSNADKNSADVNGDKAVNIVDALLVAQYYVGINGIKLDGCSSTGPVVTEEPIPAGGSAEYDMSVPMGWAVVPGYGIQTTTGGAGGEVVTATSSGQVSGYAKGDAPRIILIKGNISGTINIEKNKTLIGVGAKLNGMLNMSGAQNVIIRNLEIDAGTDAIAGRKTNHLWIDHVYCYSGSDGLIDLTRETDMYTISWTHLAKHDKCMLLNGGSRHYGDRGKLNGTVHHNWFNGTNQRNPRAGFGKIHIFNDYNLKNKSYGIGYHTECLVLAEANYFEGMKNCIKQMYEGRQDEMGDALSVGNKFVNATGNGDTGKGFDPKKYYVYDFTLDKVDDVANIVKAGVGPKKEFENIGLMPIPGQGAVGVSGSKLSWLTGTHNPKSYVVYFGTTTNPPKVASSSSNSYNAGSLSSGKRYYWRVDQVTSSGTVQGKLWTFVAK